MNPHLRGGRVENHLGPPLPPVHPTEILTSISPSSAVELNTSALSNYVTEANILEVSLSERILAGCQGRGFEADLRETRGQPNVRWFSPPQETRRLLVSPLYNHPLPSSSGGTNMSYIVLSVVTICSLLSLLLDTIVSGTVGPEVVVTHGALKGRYLTSRNGREFVAFLGIQYAKPPLGELRFRLPDGSSNVLPVMVWFHGGGWVSGAGTSKFYGPQFLLDKDIVLVTVTYRLGPIDECQPFLQRFQTSKPMTPYLFEAVEKLLRYLMNRCVKPDLMKCTGPKLLSIDTKKSENLILSKNIDIGFATKRLLGETAITVTERQKLEFIHECRSMLTTMIAKLQEKSPLKQKAVRGLSSLDPCVIQHSPQLAQKRFSFLLEELNHANIINDVLAENAKKEYLHFCNLKKSELQEIFRPCDQFSDEVGLDTIYGSFLIGEANYKHLWEVIKICLVLSHGNATVEGGFSVNKSLLVENMHEKTVIAQRHIHDEIQEAGGIKNIHISKKMLDYVRGARKRYHEYLEMKKQEKSEKDKKKAEKRKLDIQVKDLEGERKKLMMATEEKREAIDVELQELKKKQASLY
uniref:Carboxylesterase type B domain-containing protein n=1 Tax=Timema cristinae TaxID=61476 RepID=A0A7R9CZT0_TIMCR|nr:unnamed protein product [Timema cristinae]